MKPFLETLDKEGILADGAMGSEIYSRGVFINRCFDELNLSNPKLIEEIHLDYLAAGSSLIETNTFSASAPRLAAYGLEGKLQDINRAAVKIAKKAAGAKAYVAGSIGPLGSSHKSAIISLNDIKKAYAEQIAVLADEGVDVIIMETFTNLEELHQAYLAAREVCKLPLVLQISTKYIGEDEFVGLDPALSARMMVGWGADVIGMNCGNGPEGIFAGITKMSKAVNARLSAMPNAGVPRDIEGRMLYMASPEYMAEYARRYAQLGVSLIGGCCGTTPAMIREMKKYLKALRPSTRIEVVVEKQKDVEKLPEVPIEKRSAFGAGLGKKFQVCVEIDPPLGVDPNKAIENAMRMKEMGVDAINIADGPRALARMSPIALGALIKDKVGIEPIVHYCCRDRNTLGMQMDLIGANAIGLKNVLIITGDPPKMGNYPDATAVFDMDSIGLIHFVKNLNQGLDFANRPLKGSTSFVVGCGCNPCAVDFELEVRRYKQKVLAGAEFVFSQPIYDTKALERFLFAIKDLRPIPFFVGVLPIPSLKYAEFLNSEVPGMEVPKPILERLEKAATKEAQQDVGLSVAKESLRQAKGLSQIKGVYIFPPFGKYSAVEELMGVLV